MKTRTEKVASHFKSYRAYYFSYALFLVCLFTSPYVYSFFDVHITDSCEHYERDKANWERQNGIEIAFMPYAEWLQQDQQRDTAILAQIGSEFAECFDPWFEPKPYEHDFGREE